MQEDPNDFVISSESLDTLQDLMALIRDSVLKIATKEAWASNSFDDNLPLILPCHVQMAVSLIIKER